MNLKEMQTSIIFSTALLFLMMGVLSCSQDYSLSIDCAEGGTVEIDPDGYSYSEYESVSLTAVPDSDYYFTSWGNISEYSYDYSTSDEISIIMPGESIELSAGFSKKDEGWTFMIYLAGDNSLSSYVDDDINEMEEGLYDALEAGNSEISSSVVVLVLADYSSRGDDTVLYLLSPDNTGEIVSSEISDDAFSITEDLNMGDPEVLADFIEFGLKEYPSLYNALILWNHGGGSKSLSFSETVSRNICSDETSNDILYNDELQQGIEEGLSNASMDELDIIGIDACLMGTVETAYELRDLALFYTGSAASEWGYGWDYQEIFNQFSTGDDIPLPSEMADIFVTQYKESTDYESTSSDNTMTSVDLSKMETLKTKIDALAAELYVEGDSASFEQQRDNSAYYYDYDESTNPVTDTSYYVPYTDLYSFCSGVSSSTDELFSAEAISAADEVLEALGDAIVSTYAVTDIENMDDYYYTDDASAERGLSIFISHGENTYSGSSYYGLYDWWYYDASIEDTNGTVYGNLDFCTSDTDGIVETWRELFEAWYDADDLTPGSY